MGQSDDWRAQLVMMSREVRAYWTTPFVPSWLGSGTLLGSGLASWPPEAEPCGCRELAESREE
jgi:hypothetical protein